MLPLSCCSMPDDEADAAEQPAPQRRREAQPAEGEAGAAGMAAETGATAGASAAAAGPGAAYLTAARDILAAPSLAQLQAAAAAATAAQQQLQPLRQVLAGPREAPQDVMTAAMQCVLHGAGLTACILAEQAWARALDAYQNDLPLRLASHLMAANCQQAVPAPARRGGRQAPRQRRISSAAAAPAAAAAAADESSEDEMDAINRAHEELDFSMAAQRVLGGPSPNARQRAARAGNVHAYAVAAAAPPPPAQPAWRQRPADPMSALRSGWDDTSAYLEMMSGGSDMVDFMRLHVQRAALSPPQQLLGDIADTAAMQAELAGWRNQVRLGTKQRRRHWRCGWRSGSSGWGSGGGQRWRRGRRAAWPGSSLSYVVADLLVVRTAALLQLLFGDLPAVVPTTTALS